MCAADALKQTDNSLHAKIAWDEPKSGREAKGECC